MMFVKVLATAVSIGAIGGASLAVAQNITTPAPVTADEGVTMQHVAQRSQSAVCSDVDFRIYFEPGSNELNAEARDTIAAAAKDVRGCGRLDVELAADQSRIDTSVERRLSSQRSVAVLTEMRRQGVAGDVFIAPLRDVVVASEDNAGPDFVEVGIAPSTGGQLLSSVSNVNTDM